MAKLRVAIIGLAMLGFAMPVLAGQQVYTFDVCGAPNSYEPGWMPNGDPMVNGKMTLIIDSDKGLMTLQPSQELLDSTRYVSLHGHLYDLQHRYDNSELGQSTICWAYYNHVGRGGHCAKNDYDCQTLTGVENWPWTKYGYAVDWYRGYLRTVAREEAEGWWFMYHSAGGHFATDEDGHLIEWDGSPYMESSFLGRNNIRPDCNARLGRTLGNRDFGHGDKCNEMLKGVFADDYFLDADGVAWLDENGNLTADAIAHGYDLDTEYLFYNYRDNGQSDRWGGPDGGAGGFITGDSEGRCENWPPEEYGQPHTHEEGYVHATLPEIAVVPDTSGIRIDSGMRILANARVNGGGKRCMIDSNGFLVHHGEGSYVE